MNRPISVYRQVKCPYGVACKASALSAGKRLQVECPYRVAGKASALGAGNDIPTSAYLDPLELNGKWYPVTWRSISGSPWLEVLQWLYTLQWTEGVISRNAFICHSAASGGDIYESA